MVEIKGKEPPTDRGSNDSGKVGVVVWSREKTRTVGETSVQVRS